MVPAPVLFGIQLGWTGSLQLNLVSRRLRAATGVVTGLPDSRREEESWVLRSEFRWIAHFDLRRLRHG